MALLDEIHEEISPQLMTLHIMWEDVIEPEDLLDRGPFLKVDHDAECVGK